MLFAEKMDRVSILVLRRDSDAVLAETARLGVLHPARLEDFAAWARDFAALAPAEVSHELLARRQKVAHLIQELGVRPPASVAIEPATLPAVPLETLDTTIEQLEGAAQPLLTERDALRSRLNALRTVLSKGASFLALGLPVSALAQSSAIISAIGVVEETQVDRLREQLAPAPALVLPFGSEKNEVRVLCLTLRTFRDLFEQSLKAVSFRETVRADELSGPAGASETFLREEIERLEGKLTENAAQITRVGAAVTPKLMSLLRTIDVAQVLSRLRMTCRLTDSSCLFTGWTPSDKAADLVAAVRKRTGGRAVIDALPADAMDEAVTDSIEVPVLLRHPKFLEPFELIVENYGSPSYRMVDPTAFLAAAFLVMFGMMFGDLGHGAVLAAVGLFLSRKYPTLNKVGRLMTYCGASASVFGVLFGSVFGFETLTPALWTTPFANIGMLFKTAIGFGVALISVGIALNVVNAIRTRSLVTRFFEPSGALGGIAYWAGIVAVIHYTSSETNTVNFGFAAGILLLSLIGFFLKGPVLRLLGKQERAFPEGVAAYVLEGMVEILELVMGYLANTVSFVRVAAFGLAHAGLLVAVFALSDLVAGLPAGPVLSALVLILGNVFVIVFEGAVVTIQSLRLEYYEFFGKFFKTFGVRYAPVRYTDACVVTRR